MRLLRSIDSRLVTLLLAAILIAGTLGILRPDTFLSPLNINSMLLQSSVIGLLSLAVAITMLTGGIDLSINATANLTSIAVAILLSRMVPAGGRQCPARDHCPCSRRWTHGRLWLRSFQWVPHRHFRLLADISDAWYDDAF